MFWGLRESRGTISCAHCPEVLVSGARQARQVFLLQELHCEQRKMQKLKWGQIVLTKTKHLFPAAGAVDNIFCFPRVLQCGYVITLQEGYIFLSERRGKSIFAFSGETKHKIVMLEKY